MAFTDLKVDNFTITDSLVFKNTTYPSHQNNYAFCQVRIKQHPPDSHHYQKFGKTRRHFNFVEHTKPLYDNT